MSLIQNLKDASLKLRKEKSPLASLSVFVLSEIKNVGMNDGHRETTENEAIVVLKKIIEKTEETVRNITDSGVNTSANINKMDHLFAEVAFLKSFMPQMVSEESIRIFLKAICADKEVLHKGEIMKKLKSNFGALINMKMASKIVENM